MSCLSVRAFRGTLPQIRPPNMHHYGFLKALGVVLIVAGGSYLVDMLALFLAPDFGAKIHTLVGVLPPAFAELWMVLYLLVKGVREPPQGAPSATAVAASARAWLKPGNVR
jgi:hypothetical protein